MKTVLCILPVLLLHTWAQDASIFSRAICGQTRFCVSQPGNCDPQITDSCDAFASWKISADGTKLELALYAATSTYVAFGFSQSDSMERSEVYACTVNSDVIRSWNIDGYGNEERTLKGVSGQTVLSTNGVISCQFSRERSLNDGDQEYFDLTSSAGVYVLMAWNGPLQSSTQLGKHPTPSGRFFWPQVIDFTQMLPEVTTMPLNPMTTNTSEIPVTASDAPQFPATRQTSPVMSSGSVSTQSSLDEETLFAKSVCGQSRFCVSKPLGCDPLMGSCDAFTSWKLSDDKTKVEFALYAKTTTYIAMGLTETRSMDDSDVYACTSGSDNILRSRNDGYQNSDRELKGVSDAAIAVTDGVITCQFSRLLSLGDADSEFFDLTSGDFHIILSWGGSLSGRSLRKHISTAISSSSFDFTQPLPEVSTANTMVTNEAGCGKTMGCFSTPSNCDRSSSCVAFSSWVASQDKTSVSIELQATTDTYIAIGFSKSGQMDNSDVYACTANGEVRRSRNDGHQNTPQDLKGVSNQSVTVANGVITCRFTRVVSLEDNDELFFDLSQGNAYTILLAWDGPLADNGIILRHRAGRIPSPQKYDLTDIAEGGSEPGRQNAGIALRKTHGSLMVVAWLFLVSIGITTARYFKDLPGEICGKPVWFAIHRLCMATAVCIFMVAFILIIIAVPGFYQLRGPGNAVRALHSIFGVIVILLGIINVIMAIFRPHPGEPRRNLYNWAHWGVGTSAHLIALTTIFLGTANFPDQRAFPLLPTIPSFVFYLVLAFLVSHVILWLIFTFLKAAKNSEETPARSNDIALQNGQESQPDQPPEKKSSTSMLALYVSYIVIALVITIVIIASVVA